VALDQRHQFVGCGIRIGLRPAVGKHARPAIPEVRRRETRCKGQRRHRVAFERRELFIDALGRLVVGALPGDRDQERQLPERFCKTRFRLQHQREVSCTGAAGVGHVDVGIGAVGNECVGMRHHLKRDIGMEVEADDQRQVLADDLAYAGKRFALTIVVLFGHHGAVQIEIDGVDRPGRSDAVDHLFHDAFEGIVGDMRRRDRGRRDRRDQLPAIGFGRLDEAGQTDIDLAHDLEHVGAMRHRRPAAAMDEIVIGRLGRRERIGLVQKGANGDAGHQVSRSMLFVGGR
jgi:hypothetical protein